MNTDELFIDRNQLPQPLKEDELYKLIQESREGSKEAWDKLIIYNIRLVLYEVNRKFRNIDYDKKDLVSIGNIGLIKAINTYDSSKGINFSTYAIKCIDNEILMFFRKLKKDHNVKSIESFIYCDEDGSELKLEDRLIDDSDFVEDYEKSETHKIIRELVKKLPDREKKIIELYFGFYNDRIHSQEEIADKLHISQSQVSRLITKLVKILGKQLESVGAIELHAKPKIKKKRKNDLRSLQSIYEYFKEYSRAQIDEMLSKLTEEERSLIKFIEYVGNLDNQVSWKLTNEDINRFNGILIPKMKKLLANPFSETKKIGKKSRKSNLLQSSIGPSMVENQDQQYTLPLEETTSIVKTAEASNDITKDDCIKIRELLGTPTFAQMMSGLTVKESVIISLKLGYVDGKYFSTEAIAQFLGIEEIEVIETTKKVLSLCIDNINSFIEEPELKRKRLQGEIKK